MRSYFDSFRNARGPACYAPRPSARLCTMTQYDVGTSGAIRCIASRALRQISAAIGLMHNGEAMYKRKIMSLTVTVNAGVPTGTPLHEHSIGTRTLATAFEASDRGPEVIVT